eukprot:4312541-Heterocapsa_arctica.AAC.1
MSSPIASATLACSISLIITIGSTMRAVNSFSNLTIPRLWKIRRVRDTGGIVYTIPRWASNLCKA